MIDRWREAITQAVGPASIADVTAYLARKPLITQSPIDNFYLGTHEILKLATPDFLDQHPTIGPLLLVGIVSMTENYFRDLFARIIHICPVAQKSSADQSINLGSVIWHGDNVERGAFENISFAGTDEIKKTCKKFLDYEPKKAGQANAILAEFGKVCEMRHAVAHSSSFLAGKNAIKLQIPACPEMLVVNVGYKQIQESCSVCTTLVISFNSELFEEMAKRWAITWREIPQWDASKEDIYFEEIWQTFFSMFDKKNKTISVPLTMKKCIRGIRKEYKI